MNIATRLQEIQYPITLRFKLFTIRQKISLTDATGRTILHTRRKFFKLREHIEIFTNESQSTLLAEIRADRVIDWSARYTFTDDQGMEIGKVGRKGWRSLFKCHYETFNPGDSKPDFLIEEENPWAKFFDGLLGEIPFIGILTLYLFHPKYLATRNGQAVMRLTKNPSFFERKFTIEKLAAITPQEELNLFLSFLMLIMLERERG